MLPSFLLGKAKASMILRHWDQAFSIPFTEVCRYESADAVLLFPHSIF